MLSKVLIKLLEAPVKPEHPIDFIRDNLGATMFEKKQIEQLEQTVRDYKQEVDELKTQVEDLKQKLNEKAVAIKPSVPVSVADVPPPPSSAMTAIASESSAVVKKATSANVSTDSDSGKKINESEKAIAPTTPHVDEVKSIESATVVVAAVDITVDAQPTGAAVAGASGTVASSTNVNENIIAEDKEITSPSSTVDSDTQKETKDATVADAIKA